MGRVQNPSNDLPIALGSDSLIHVFGQSTSGEIVHNQQSQPNSRSYSGWKTLNGSVRLTGRPVVAQNADGRLEVFARGLDHAIWHIWQVTPGGGWADGWSSLGGNLVTGPSIATRRGGSLEVFGTGPDGGVWHTWQVTPGGPWVTSGWATLGGWAKGQIAVISHYPDEDRREVYSLGLDSGIWRTRELQPGGPWVNGWDTLGGKLASTPVPCSTIATTDPIRDSMHVFAVGLDSAILHTWELQPGGPWFDGWDSLGGKLTSAPAVTTTGNNQLAVFARGTDRSIYRKWQAAPGGPWQGWNSLGGSLVGDPVLVVNDDDRQEVFAYGPDNAIWHTWELSPGGPWFNGWDTLGGNLTGL